MECKVQNKKYIFVGNRFFVLKKMIDLDLDIENIFAVKDSFLSQWLDKEKIKYRVLPAREEFVELLKEIPFDYLISNGCPYILPISKVFNGHNNFINIHPSLLPELRGKNPINGALLFGRRHGVTCHYMTDEIDKGKICSQIEIPITEDLDLELLYQISFRIEARAFEEAFDRGFTSINSVISDSDKVIYYSRKNNDAIISKDENVDMIIKKVRAFGTKGQYASFFHKGFLVEVSSAEIIRNPIMREIFNNCEENKVLLAYGEGKLIFKMKNEFIKFRLCQPLKLAEGAKLMD